MCVYINTIAYLFSEKEKEVIIKEFCYSRRLNRNTVEESREETSIFTEHNLETSMNDLTKNISSKSIILAPFNSTKTELSSIHLSVEDMIEDRKVLKLGTKVREVDRQYERNNNCELDNGVYNKFIETETETGKEQCDKGLNPFGTDPASLDHSLEPDATPITGSKKGSHNNSSSETKTKKHISAGGTPTTNAGSRSHLVGNNSSSGFVFSSAPTLVIGTI